MDAPIHMPPSTLSAAFRDERSAREIVRRLVDAGIGADQVSIAHRNSAVLSAANDPATTRATGKRSDPERNRDLAEPGFYVRSQAEHQNDDNPVLVIVAPEAGQEDLIRAVFAGRKIQRLYPSAGEREFFAGGIEPTPAVLPNERAGNDPTLWWRMRQRIRFMPVWAQAAIFLGIGGALAFGGMVRSKRRHRREEVGDPFDRAA